MTRRGPTVGLPPEIAATGPIRIESYQRVAHLTDRMPQGEMATAILGLFGEIGSLLAALKKKRREGAAYATYDATIREELGDVLWYLNAVASRAQVNMSVIAQKVANESHHSIDVVPSSALTFGDIRVADLGKATDVASRMTELAAAAGKLVEALRVGDLDRNPDALAGHLVAILRAIVSSSHAAGVDLNVAIRSNLEKPFSRWPLEGSTYPLADPPDSEMPINERLPRKFRIFVKEHEAAGKTYVLQKCNGVIIGDRLTDNKAEKDDYRFHDVFHYAYAVHLEWSPVLRSLFRVKRKSRSHLDENEDGARAILIEEGIATLVFGRALERGLFDGLPNLDYDLLKLVTDFARGYEVERCAAWQWERAILDGFKVFREITAAHNRKGTIVGDLDEHTLHFVPGDEPGDPTLPRAS